MKTTLELPDALVVSDKETGLPVIQCKHEAPEGEELTPERVADILLAQEANWHHGDGR